jgi:glucose/arabinose dehydrogenase/PKD repeat protein
MRTRSTKIAFALCLALLLSGVALAIAPLPTYPEFTDELVANNITQPTGFAFTPDGRMLVISKPGELHVYAQDGTKLKSPALSLQAKICNRPTERGLLGIAVDPQFTTNRFIYLYYTKKVSGQCVQDSREANRISRFVLPDNNTVDTASETVLIDNIPSYDGTHNGGGLSFGKDGNLYISVGDMRCYYADFQPGSPKCNNANPASGELNTLLGKILRITRDGGIPADNPFQGTDSARCNTTGGTDAGKKCREIYAYGVRNSFRMVFDPNAPNTRFFFHDVGLSSWEEINEGQAGANYGWPKREGACPAGKRSNCSGPPAGMTDPIFSYVHDSPATSIFANCTAIVGGAIVPNGVWPAEFDGAYIFSDYQCGKMFQLKPKAGSGYQASEFLTGLLTPSETQKFGSVMSVGFGPKGSNQALYYTVLTSFGAGQVRRLVYTGNANRRPFASAQANPPFGPAPLDVTFDASGSSDPNGDALTYLWNFGDGSPASEVTTPQVSHRYQKNGAYTATLHVRDSQGATSDPFEIRIDVGNAPPIPVIESPTDGLTYKVGELLTVRGSATDPDGDAVRLIWSAVLHHADHTHPLLEETEQEPGQDITITAREPEEPGATTNSYVTVILKAIDSKGRETVVTRSIQPRKVPVTFVTEPPGLKLDLNGAEISSGQEYTSWEGYVMNVTAPTQQDQAGRMMKFERWRDSSDGNTRAITTGGAPATYTAVFTPAGPSDVPGSYQVRLPLILK